MNTRRCAAAWLCVAKAWQRSSLGSAATFACYLWSVDSRADLPNEQLSMEAEEQICVSQNKRACVDAQILMMVLPCMCDPTVANVFVYLFVLLAKLGVKRSGWPTYSQAGVSQAFRAEPHMLESRAESCGPSRLNVLLHWCCRKTPKGDPAAEHSGLMR